uniref:hypothetical protein n=1 Tax=Prevotella sp. TaxID=59823 RepID=UPI0040265498
MTTLQLNQELLRQVGNISNDDNLLRKVIGYIKSLTSAKKTPKADKASMLQDILSMSKPCPMSDEEINEEVEKGRQAFYDGRVGKDENNH